MSLLSRIEAELVTLSPANFQKLGDAYLARFRGWRIQSWGTMIGADKDRTGVPDAYCQLPDGRFVYLAYTTAEQGIAAKLAKDLTDCISRTQPAIQPGQVERICLVFNRRCPPETAAALDTQARTAGYVLELINIDELARMVHEYSPLAHDLINLDLGRGQLVHATDFVEIYGRQLGATPLTHALVGRETEQDNFRDKLTQSDLILVTGPAGVGKTQMVLTVVQAYCAEQPDQRQLFVVYDKKSPDFVHELQAALRPGQQVLVIADDANRVSPYFRVLLAEQLARPAGTLKIIATVRDYARDAVVKAATKNHYELLEVKPLTDEAIAELIGVEPYGVKNGDYVSRIQQLSDGRPRLAIMAAQVARKTQRLQSLYNVKDLYESYFAPILDDLATRENPLLSKVLALIHFFRVVKQDNEQLAQQVEDAFGITPEQFWSTAQDLHDAELVEMYEDRIVKTADQVLGNYVFYNVFFTARPALSYAKLLLTFFSQWQSRIIDTLNSALNDFGQKTIEPRLAKPIEQWLQQPDLTEEDRWKFYHVFWLFLIPQIITEASDHLATLPWPPFHPDNYPVEKNKREYLREAPLFEVLKDLCRHHLDELPTAFFLLIEFTAKHPNHFEKALEFLRLSAQFDIQDYRHFHGLGISTTLLKILSVGTSTPVYAEWYRWLTAHILPTCLTTEVQRTYAGRKRNSISFTTAELPESTETEEWRAAVWQQLFNLYPADPELTVQGIHQYLQQRHGSVHGPAWRKWDAQRLIPFLDNNLDPNNFMHCRLVHQYCQWLDGRAPGLDTQPLRRKFTTPLYRRYDLLVYYQPYQRTSEKKLNRVYGDKLHELIRLRTKPLHFKSLPAYTKLIDEYHLLLHYMQEVTGYPDERGQLIESLAEILSELTERDIQLASSLITYLHTAGNPSKFHPWRAIQTLAQHDFEAGYQLISIHEYQNKAAWQRLYLTHLPADKSSQEWLQELYRVFQSGQLTNFNFHGLTQYENLSDTLYPDLLKIAFTVAEQTPEARLPYDLINCFGKFFFPDNISLLKRYYRWQQKNYNHSDWDSEDLEAILQYDESFFLELLQEEFDKYMMVSVFGGRPLDFLWKNSRYESLLLVALELLMKQDTYLREEGIVESFFPKNADEDTQKKMYDFVVSATKGASSQKLILFLFIAVRESLSAYFVQYLNLILKAFPDNPDGLFEKLEIIPSSRSYSGSRIPILESEKQTWQSVVVTIDQQTPQTMQLFSYRDYAIRHIRSLDKQILREAEDEFTDPY
jgi:hypothetical protein